MGIKTLRQPPNNRDLAPCDFWLFPKLRGCRYETIFEMKEAVTKVIDTPTQEDFHGAFQKLLERYNNCIAAGWDYFEGDKSFMWVLSIKVPIQKKSGNLSYALRIYIGRLLLAKCSTNMFIQGLNLVRWVHFLQRKPLHHMGIHNIMSDSSWCSC